MDHISKTASFSDKSAGRGRAAMASLGEPRRAASNEGGVPISPQAYRYMIQPVDKGGRPILIEDCQEQIDDMRNACLRVAEHDMPEKLKGWYELYRLDSRLERHLEREEFEEATLLRDRMRATQAALETGRQGGPRSAALRAKVFDAMPGISTDKVRVCEFLNCLMPTDIVTEDGAIRINANFIKLMRLLAMRGAKGNRATIYDFPVVGRRAALGEFYSSVLYSVALHAIRGHFPLDEEGAAAFRPEEELAQGERGRRHLLANLLAQYFYWIMFVELHRYPQKRATELMMKDPRPFRGLTEAQRRNFPAHLLRVGTHLRQSGALPYPVEFVPTRVTEKDVEELLRSYGCPRSAAS